MSQLVEVQRYRRETRNSSELTEEINFYITSLSSDIELLAEKIRQHWAIENSLHQMLDVGCEEDASRMRKGHAATKFSVAREISMNYLMPGKSKAAIKKMRKHQHSPRLPRWIPENDSEVAAHHL